MARQKLRKIGAPSAEDEPNALLKTASQVSLTQSYSIRDPPLPERVIPSLETCCCRIFAENLSSYFDRVDFESHNGRKLEAEEEVKKEKTRLTREQLLSLPDHLVSRLLNALRIAQPTKLIHPFIAAYFIRGTTIKFTSSMLGVNKKTIIDVGEIGPNLVALELSGLDWIKDKDFAVCIERCINLLSLNLRYASNSTATKSLNACQVVR